MTALPMEDSHHVIRHSPIARGGLRAPVQLVVDDLLRRNAYVERDTACLSLCKILLSRLRVAIGNVAPVSAASAGKAQISLTAETAPLADKIMSRFLDFSSFVHEHNKIKNQLVTS